MLGVLFNRVLLWQGVWGWLGIEYSSDAFSPVQGSFHPEDVLSCPLVSLLPVFFTEVSVLPMGTQARLH